MCAYIFSKMLDFWVKMAYNIGIIKKIKRKNKGVIKIGGNTNLARANREKNDEFYTRLTDIEKELRHYRKHFKGKTILCNCDDPFESNFFKYFVLNFNKLGLKKLIATCYATSSISNKELSLSKVLGNDEAKEGRPYKAVVTKIYDATGDGGIDMLDVAELFKMGENELTELKEDGDFRSEECLELLKDVDIVVTNPPFSLFREYVAILVEYDKKFIIIGNQNAITYKEIFPLLKDNIIWLGNNNPAPKLFYVPTLLEERKNIKKDENGDLVATFGNICWFTNLDIKKRHEDLILIKKYNDEDYPTYDNYDAIEVSRVKNIPYDYEGVMGVPITFMDKYNPDQFQILGSQRWSKSDDLIKAHVSGNIEMAINDKKTLINGKETYDRIFIRNKRPEIIKDGYSLKY